MPEEPEKVRARRRTRRWSAAVCGVMALVLLAAGFLLTRKAGAAHDLGVIALGNGLGLGVAAPLIALGYNPYRRK